ncbi:unnamed protein product [Ilex paraguariensis]|uniref:Uncharacterized protein n=1 Tax=Ilex paraguariensis TaxID=185542 RepID=A0ABC8S6P0_9AQUA
MMVGLLWWILGERDRGAKALACIARAVSTSLTVGDVAIVAEERWREKNIEKERGMEGIKA